MKGNLLLMGVGAAVMFAFQASHSRLQGESQAAPVPAPVVAVLDVSRVFKEHTRFNEAMGSMKEKVAHSEKQLAAERETIKAQAAALELLDSTTDAFREGNEELTRLKVVFNAKIEEQKKEFLDHEEKLYREVYRDVERAVASYAQAHGIRLVIRCNSDRDAKDREALLKLINQPVVYTDRIDITAAIIEAVNTIAQTEP